MTNTRDYRFLLSERGTLARMLQRIPPEHVIDRLSLEGRLEQVEEQIAAFEAAPTYLVETQIAFRGRPVVDGGLKADFAVKAIGAFTDAVATVGACQARNLSPYGRLPNRSAFEMAVRNVDGSSFGFQIEREFPHGAPPEEPAALESAIEQFKAILEASAADTDEAAWEAMAKIDERARRSVRKFLETMEKADAYCAIAFKGDQFRFRDAAHVRDASIRMAQYDPKARESVLPEPSALSA